MCQKVVATMYMQPMTADRLSGFYRKAKEIEKTTGRKVKLVSAIVQFVTYEHITDEDPEDIDITK